MLRRGETVTVVAPEEHAGRLGVVSVPLWMLSQGDHRIGVLLNGERGLTWVTAVEVTRRYVVRAKDVTGAPL